MRINSRVCHSPESFAIIPSLVFFGLLASRSQSSRRSVPQLSIYFSELAVNYQIYGTVTVNNLIQDILDPEWRQIQNLLQFMVIYCLIYQALSVFLKRSHLFILIAGLVLVARLTYLGGIFYFAIALLNYAFSCCLIKNSLLPFAIWIFHIVLLNMIYLFDGFEMAWKKAGSTMHEIDLSTSFPWKYIYIWGMLRMISYSIDHHYALIES